MVFASLKKIFTAQRNKLTGFHVEFATCGCTQDVPKSHGSKIQLSSPVHTVHWRAGASLPSRPNGAIFLYICIYIFISGVDVCRNVLRNSK